MSGGQAAALRTWAPGAWRRHLRDGYADHPLVERREARQLAEQVVLRDLAPAPGVAWFPLVAPASRVDRAEVAGVLAQVRVGGSSPLPALDQRRVVAWVTGLVGEPPERLADAPQLGFDEVPPGWTVIGRSWELAAALALLTHLLGRSVRPHLVVSARLAGGPGGIGAVDGLGTKARILADEAPEATALLAAESGTAPLDGWLPRDWRGELALRLDVSPEQRAREMWAAWSRGDRDTAERLVPVVLASRRPEVQAVARWVRGSAALHRGHPEAGLADLSAARRVFLERRPRLQYQVEELDASLGIAMLDLLDPVTACQLLGEALDRLAAVPEPDRFERWAVVTLQVAGSLRRALVATGQPARARAIQETWLLDQARHDPEQARAQLDLGDVCLRLGDRAAACRALDSALAELVHVEGPSKGMTSRFLAIQRVRAGLDQAPPEWLDDRGPDWGAFPQPLELAEALLGLDRTALERALEAWPTTSRAPELYVSSRLAALLLTRHPGLAWARAVLEGLRPHVEDPRMGPGAEAALDAALEGQGAAWAARVAY